VVKGQIALIILVAGLCAEPSEHFTVSGSRPTHEDEIGSKTLDVKTIMSGTSLTCSLLSRGAISLSRLNRFKVESTVHSLLLKTIHTAFSLLAIESGKGLGGEVINLLVSAVSDSQHAIADDRALKAGRCLKVWDASHNNLLLTLLRLDGEDRPKFSDFKFTSGRLAALV
jgi:hypothetical protein